MSLNLRVGIVLAVAAMGAILFGGMPASAVSPMIATVAGGFANDGAAPTSTTIDTPQGVVVDGSGNQYIVDAKDCRVRKVTALAITTVAGTGGCGYGGDGGPATAASLKAPQGLAIDTSGNLYVADTGNCVVRKISTTGTITTIAGTVGLCFGASPFGDGGPATSAVLNLPYGVAVDGVGNLYIADSGNCRIRKVASGTITTYAGSNACGYSGDGGSATAATLSGPQGVGVDAGGTVYIADTGNCLVRKVFGGTISLVAGHLIVVNPGPPQVLGGKCAFDGDGLTATLSAMYGPTGVAVSGGNVYISDTGNCLVRVVTGGLLNTFAGSGSCGFGGDSGAATAAQLNLPGGIAFNTAGSLFIADAANCRLRMVASGTISTVAGNGVCGFGGDGGPTAKSVLHGPTGVAVFGSTVYIADTGNCRVRQIVSHIITTVAGTGTCAYSGDNGLATSAALNGPQGLAVDTSGNLYIADTGNCRVRKIVGTTISTVAGNGVCSYSGDSGLATSAAISPISGITLDGSNNLYIADTGNCRVRKVTGTTISTIAGNGTCGFAGDGGAATSANLYYPHSVAVSGSTVYIADTVNCRIRKITGTTITTFAGGVCGYSGDGGAATSAALNGPQGVKVDGSGNVYIADTGNCRVRKVTGTTITTFAGNGACTFAGDFGSPTAASLNGPTKVALDASGNVLIADTENNRVRGVFSPDTDGDGLGDGAETTIYGTNINNVDTDGDGCHDYPEVTRGYLDPTNPWDFYSVPVPALYLAANPQTDFKDSAISASDAQAVFAYFRKNAHTGTLEYEQDLNLNGVKDGIEYDRSVLGSAKSGPPDGSISAQDAQLAFSEFKAGYLC